MLLGDRVVIVAGVGPGLGVALAERFVAHGASVVLAARSADRLAAIRARLGDRALDVAVDLADPSAANRVTSEAVRHFGRIDGLVYNAALFSPLEPVISANIGDIEATLAVNVLGPLELVRAAAPAMTGNGSVVLVGSAVVRHPKPGFGVYNVGKHALLGLARSLALELGPAGIRVNTIAAGKIAGQRLQTFLADLAARRGVSFEDVHREYVSRIALGRIPEPEDYADAATFLLSDLARSVTGHMLDVNGGEYFD